MMLYNAVGLAAGAAHFLILYTPFIPVHFRTAPDVTAGGVAGDMTTGGGLRGQIPPGGLPGGQARSSSSIFCSASSLTVAPGSSPISVSPKASRTAGGALALIGSAAPGGLPARAIA